MSKTLLPVTVLSGFLGAGKSTLLTHLLNNRAGLRVAVIVNDMSEINIDAENLRDGVALHHQEERLVEMTNGCICCTLREDLLTEIIALAAADRFDYLLIESTGISEPLPVAETFTFTDDKGISLSDVARLDTMVTVVDGINFLRDYRGERNTEGTAVSATDGDSQPSLSSLLIQQVEFANVIIINKTDLITPEELASLKATLTALNPEARILTSSHGQVAPEELINTSRFNMLEAANAPGWLKTLRGEELPESDEYGVSSMLYRAHVPFHPERFYQLIKSMIAGGELIRSKGVFWLASRYMTTMQLSQAGALLNTGDGGPWWRFVPEQYWPGDAPRRDAILRHWRDETGDCRQEMVFIGQIADKARLQKQLDSCLLTLEETLAGADTWKALPDPFTDSTAEICPS